MLNVLLPGFGVIDSRTLAGVRFGKRKEETGLTHCVIFIKSDGGGTSQWHLELDDETFNALHETIMQIYQYGFAKYGYPRKVIALREQLLSQGRCPDCGCPLETCAENEHDEEGITLEEAFGQGDTTNEDDECEACESKDYCIGYHMKKVIDTKRSEPVEIDPLEAILKMKGMPIKRIKTPLGEGIMFRVGTHGKDFDLSEILSRIGVKGKMKQ
jgi:hypothetical protein